MKLPIPAKILLLVAAVEALLILIYVGLPLLPDSVVCNVFIHHANCP